MSTRSALLALVLIASACAPTGDLSPADTAEATVPEPFKKPDHAGPKVDKGNNGRDWGGGTDPGTDTGTDTGTDPVDTGTGGDTGTDPVDTGTADPSLLFSDDFEAYAVGEGYLDEEVMGSWVVYYTGYGSVGIEDDSDGSRVHTQYPMTSTAPDETHASLLYTTESFSGDIDVTVRAKTVEQLRTGSSPNTWEVGWLLWNFTTEATERAYYAILKTNGWEIGKFYGQPPDNQEFLATGSSPTITVDAWHTLRVRQVGATITLWIDGVEVATVTDSDSRWEVFTSGSVALYNEDAHVHFDDVEVRAP